MSERIPRKTHVKRLFGKSEGSDSKDVYVDVERVDNLMLTYGNEGQVREHKLKWDGSGGARETTEVILKNPENSEETISIDIIDKLFLTDDTGQRSTIGFDNSTSNSKRQVSPVRVTHWATNADDELNSGGKVDNSPTPEGDGYSPNTEDYSKTDEDDSMYIDVEVCTQYSATLGHDPENNSTAGQDGKYSLQSQYLTKGGSAGSDPVRLDPLQNIVNVQWSTPLIVSLIITANGFPPKSFFNKFDMKADVSVSSSKIKIIEQKKNYDEENAFCTWEVTLSLSGMPTDEEELFSINTSGAELEKPGWKWTFLDGAIPPERQWFYPPVVRWDGTVATGWMTVNGVVDLTKQTTDVYCYGCAVESRYPHKRLSGPKWWRLRYIGTSPGGYRVANELWHVDNPEYYLLGGLAYKFQVSKLYKPELWSNFSVWMSMQIKKDSKYIWMIQNSPDQYEDRNKQRHIHNTTVRFSGKTVKNDNGSMIYEAWITNSDIPYDVVAYSKKKGTWGDEINNPPEGKHITGAPPMKP